MSNFVDLTDQRFGRLLVLSRIENNKSKKAVWLCKCDCSTIKSVIGSDLRSGKTVSCGCYYRQRASEKFTKHKLCNSRQYSIYNNMKSRCLYEGNKDYKDYGNRGITICDEWLADFMSFYNWSLENGYQETLTLDRIDNSSNYCPENCRWTTMKEQCSNRRPKGVNK